MESDRCPVCGSSDLAPFFELAAVPALIGVQWPTPEEAVSCPRGDVRLVFCRGCTFIYNDRFDPGRLEYTRAYENPLYFSAFFRDYARSVAQRLIDRYGLRRKTVVEIGCGKGDFLSLLCELGENRGLGFDPSYEEGRADSGDARRFTVVRDLYSERYADRSGDLVAARYVLEHIPSPQAFLGTIRRTIGQRDAIVYMEVPDVLFILKDLSVWDVIYEHCSYFGARSLAEAFSRCSFEVLAVTSQYAGQYLGIEARPAAAAGGGQAGAPAAPETRDAIEGLVAAFSGNVEGRLAAWRSSLARLECEKLRAVVWGAGAKAVGFLNLLAVREQIPYVVDINPHKHGNHIAGTGQRIVPPEFLRSYRPDVVILTNPVYRREIEAAIKTLGVRTEFMEV